MVRRTALPLESLIRRLASLPSHQGEGPEVFRARLQVLCDTLNADAFAFLKKPEESKAYSVFAGDGLLAPSGKTPSLSTSTLPGGETLEAAGDNQSEYSLKGPFSDAFLLGEKARAVLIACLGSGKGSVATLALRRTGKRFTLSEEKRFASIAYVLNLEMRLGQGPEASEGADPRDPTTGLGYFPQFIQALGKEISRSRRNAGKVAVGVLSLGRGKEGAFLQEKVMKRIAGVMKAHLRNFDTIVRYSGRELAFVLPDVGGEEVFGVMNRVLDAIAEDESQAPPAVHIGFSSYPEDASTVERLIETAEAALNLARDKGNFAVSCWKR